MSNTTAGLIFLPPSTSKKYLAMREHRVCAGLANSLRYSAEHWMIDAEHPLDVSAQRYQFRFDQLEWVDVVKVREAGARLVEGTVEHHLAVGEDVLFATYLCPNGRNESPCTGSNIGMVELSCDFIKCGQSSLQTWHTAVRSRRCKGSTARRAALIAASGTDANERAFAQSSFDVRIMLRCGNSLPVQ